MTALLNQLWMTSLLLMAAALAWMSWLILSRLFRERSQANRAEHRKSVSRAYLQIMGGDAEGEARLQAYQHQARLLAESLLEVMGLVRGAERERLVAALTRLEVDATLRDRLNRGSRTGRLAAAEALAAFSSQATTAALSSLYMASRDGEVRIAAIRSLIEIDAAPSIEAVVVDLEKRGETESLQHLPVLRRLASADPDAALAVFNSPDRSPTLRAVLAEALAGSGAYSCLPALIDATSDPNAALRLAAVRGIGQLAHPAASAAVEAALHDAAWDVRAEACATAAKLGARQLAPSLTACLNDAEWWVRFRATEALQTLGLPLPKPEQSIGPIPLDLTPLKAVPEPVQVVASS